MAGELLILEGTLFIILLLKIRSKLFKGLTWRTKLVTWDETQSPLRFTLSSCEMEERVLLND